jgi:hypothetical protein
VSKEGFILDEDFRSSGLYIKIGKRYKELSKDSVYLYTIGRPRNGIWRVADHSCTWLGEIVPPNRIKVQELEDSILKGLERADSLLFSGKGISRADIARFIMDEVIKYHDKVEGKISESEGKVSEDRYWK